LVIALLVLSSFPTNKGTMNALFNASDSPVVPRPRLLSTASSSSSAASSGSVSDSSADISTNAGSDYSFEEESTSEGLLRLAKAASAISHIDFSFAASASSPMTIKTAHVVSDYYSSPESSESSAASTPPPSFVTSSEMMPPTHYVGLGSIGGPHPQYHAHNERPRMMMAGASGSAVDTPAYPPRYSSYADIGWSPAPAVVVPGGKSTPQKKRKYTKSGLYARKAKAAVMSAEKSAPVLAFAPALFPDETPKTMTDIKTKDKKAKKFAKKGGKKVTAKKCAVKKMKSSSSNTQLLQKKVVQISNTTSLTDTLLQMLNDPDVQHITSWQRHGQAFDIHDKDAFVDKVLPLYFPYSRSTVANAKYTSFTRKLNRYGFRLMNRGKLAGGYHHPLFHRDRPELAKDIACESKPKTSRRK